MNFPENPKDLTANQRWIRLPKTGPCEWCGLSRSHLAELIKAQKIRSVSLRRPGNIRGIRLIWLPSIFAYIERNGQVTDPTSTVAGKNRTTSLNE